ncbi:GRF1-interacting factor 1 [Porphyridium purpureum]|uniref:GRF1-interacting factor 1 n=1 Tax=Porphyridium purpureum TaxID=35688 RepID=A0A5J4Z406_PORPP|nr:GRF1-interacting factor 1 [Porphyridium purpureum]|eukprot:POR5820..scf295_1
MDSALVTTEDIQELLDENQRLLLAVIEAQSAGRSEEASAIQGRLQSNLVKLASLADQQQSPPSSAPKPTPLPAQQHAQRK